MAIRISFDGIFVPEISDIHIICQDINYIQHLQFNAFL